MIAAWATLWMVPLFVVLKKLGVLRIPVEMELGGLDIPKHDEQAYPPSAWEGFLPLHEEKTVENPTILTPSSIAIAPTADGLTKRNHHFFSHQLV